MTRKILLVLLCAVLVAAAAISLVACGEAADIVGKWYHITTFGLVSESSFYIFEKDGTGSTPYSREFEWRYDDERERYIIDESDLIEFSDDRKVIKIDREYYTKGDRASTLPESVVNVYGMLMDEGEAFTNRNASCEITFDINSIGGYALLDGTRVSERYTTISDEGTHTFAVFNSTGEISKTYTINISRTKPIIDCSAELIRVNLKQYTNKNVTLTWEGDTSTATVNGEPYDKGALLTEEGRYDVTLTDRYGNVSEATFYILRTNIDAYFRVNFATVDAESYTEITTKSFVSFNVSCIGDVVVKDEMGNIIPRTINGYKVEEGSHSFYITDFLGNEKVINYTYTVG